MDIKRLMINFVAVLTKQSIMKRTYIVYDAAVRDFYAGFRRSVKGEILGELPLICDEEHKTLANVEHICKALLDADTEKSDTLLAVGGGICSDICGLAASLYKRGMRLEIVPTTLLAIADASVGGKNGVNLAGMKNIIGTFHFPAKIHIRKEALKTLPDSEILSGSAEILKTLLLFDAKNYHKAVALFSGWAKGERESDRLEEMVRLAQRAAKLKARVVRHDPLDKGRRHLLNFGHTYAHAIEWQAQGRLSHGQAVSMGIIRALEIGEQKGWTERGLADRVKDDFQRCALPTEITYGQELDLVQAIRNDKKVENGMVDFVSLRKIGKPVRKKLKI